MVWNGLTVAPGVVPAGLGVAAGDEGHVLADDDLGFFVVQREQIRRGENVGVGIRFQHSGQCGQARYFLAADGEALEQARD